MTEILCEDLQSRIRGLDNLAVASIGGLKEPITHDLTEPQRSDPKMNLSVSCDEVSAEFP